MPKQMSLATA